MATPTLFEIVNLPRPPYGNMNRSGYYSVVQLIANDSPMLLLPARTHQSHAESLTEFLRSRNLPFKQIDAPSYLEELRQAQEKKARVSVKVIKVPDFAGSNYSIAGIGRTFLNFSGMTFGEIEECRNEYLMPPSPYQAQFSDARFKELGWTKSD